MSGGLQVAAIILAAGASRRLGQPKQLLQFGGEFLLERAARVAREAGCQPVLVIVGANADLIRSRCDLSGATVVLNEGWREGMASSIRAALELFHVEQFHVDGAVLMVCDQPAVTPEHLRALMATGLTTASEYSGKRGVPAYLPADIFPELMKLSGDSGARDLLRNAEVIPLHHGELDIDTAEELDEARRRFAP